MFHLDFGNTFNYIPKSILDIGYFSPSSTAKLEAPCLAKALPCNAPSAPALAPFRCLRFQGPFRRTVGKTYGSDLNLLLFPGGGIGGILESLDSQVESSPLSMSTLACQPKKDFTYLSLTFTFLTKISPPKVL